MLTSRLVFTRLMTAALVLLLASVVASAQTRREPAGWISFFTGGGSISGFGPTVTYIGEDATFRVYRGLGLGVGQVTGRDFGGGGNFVLFSGNLSYHFKRLDRVGPFVTAGYSTVFRNGTRVDGGNFGAGVKYWFSNHLALHLELRNHILTGASRDFFEFRVGFGMR
jgi:hypothetical protein